MHNPTPEQSNNLPTVGEPRMTAAERNELKTLVNERARLAITQVRALAAERIVELNRQLEATWKAEDLGIAETVRELERLVTKANAKIKPQLRRAEARSFDAMVGALGTALDTITAADAAAFYRAAGATS